MLRRIVSVVVVCYSHDFQHRWTKQHIVDALCHRTIYRAHDRLTWECRMGFPLLSMGDSEKGLSGEEGA
jgi:hypothetical protein